MGKKQVIPKPAELQALGSSGPITTYGLKTNISEVLGQTCPDDQTPNHCFHSGEPSAL